MKTPLFLAALLALPLVLSAETPAAHPPKMTDDLEFQHDLVIGTVDGVPIHLETAVKKGRADGPVLPAILMVHGGGWKNGTARGSMGREMPNPGLFYAQHGYFVASVDYRLSGVAKWPAQIQDCKLAVRYLRAHARELHIDPDRIGCCGFSAGGHLVACLGVMTDATEMEGNGGYAGVSSRVQAVVMISGPTDMRILFDNRSLKEAQENKDELFSPVWREHPEVLEKASPVTYVKAGLPPFWVGSGDHDQAVPLQQAELMTAALAKAGVPFEFQLVKDGGHGLTAVKDHAAHGFGEPVPPPQESLEKTLRFLDRYLKPSRG